MGNLLIMESAPRGVNGIGGWVAPEIDNPGMGGSFTSNTWSFFPVAPYSFRSNRKESKTMQSSAEQELFTLTFTKVHLKRIIPFLPAAFFWLAGGLVYLSWMARTMGGGVTPGVGSTHAGLIQFFLILFGISLAGAGLSLWASRWNHRWLWAGVFLFLGVFNFLGSLGD